MVVVVGEGIVVVIGLPVVLLVLELVVVLVELVVARVVVVVLVVVVVTPVSRVVVADAARRSVLGTEVTLLAGVVEAVAAGSEGPERSLDARGRRAEEERPLERNQLHRTCHLFMSTSVTSTASPGVPSVRQSVRPTSASLAVK